MPQATRTVEAEVMGSRKRPYDDFGELRLPAAGLHARAAVDGGQQHADDGVRVVCDRRGAHTLVRHDSSNARYSLYTKMAVSSFTEVEKAALLDAGEQRRHSMRKIASIGVGGGSGRRS